MKVRARIGEIAGCGGPFRDSNGRWIKDYSKKKIGTYDSLYTEMWGLYLDLNLAWRKIFSYIIVKSDSKILIEITSYNFKLN